MIETIVARHAPFMPSESDIVYLQHLRESDTGDFVTVEVPLLSDDGQAIVKYEMSVALGRSPRAAELRDALDAIRGAALERPRRQLTSPASASEPPLSALGMVIEQVSIQGGLSKMATDKLLQIVTTMARKMGIYDTDPTFPRTAFQLGSQLRELVEPLAKRGVPLDYEPKDRPRTWAIGPKSKVRRPDEPYLQSHRSEPLPSGGSVEVGSTIKSLSEKD